MGKKNKKKPPTHHQERTTANRELGEFLAVRNHPGYLEHNADIEPSRRRTLTLPNITAGFEAALIQATAELDDFQLFEQEIENETESDKMNAVQTKYRVLCGCREIVRGKGEELRRAYSNQGAIEESQRATDKVNMIEMKMNMMSNFIL